MARRKGIDIGSTDTRIAGTANVFRQVGRRSGAVVFMGDAGKGAAAIVFANALNVDTPLALLALAAALAGHAFPMLGLTRWPSGAGLATLSGGGAAAVGWLGPIAILAGVVFILASRRTLAGALAAFVLFLVLNVFWPTDPKDHRRDNRPRCSRSRLVTRQMAIAHPVHRSPRYRVSCNSHAML